MGLEQYRFSVGRDSALARSRIALLGLWTGAMLAFGALFVPAAFSHLPTQLAASVLGEGFSGLDHAGIALGSICAAIGFVGWRSPGGGGAAGLLRALLPLAGVLAHLVSALVVSPEIHALRVAAGGGIGGLPAGDPELAAFATLHTASRSLFGTAAGTAALACLWDLFQAAPKAAPGASPDAKTS
ncbi:MAG: DUF4149 domain-containing protein [bacterium]